MNGDPAPRAPELAPGVEWRRVQSGTVLAAPDGRGFCQIDRSLDEVAAILDASTHPDVLTRCFGEDAPRLVDELRAGGYLTDSPPAPPVRRFVLTRDGFEVAGAHRFVELVYRLIRPLYDWRGAVCLCALAVVGLSAPFLGVLPAQGAMSPVLAAAVILALDLPITVVHELGHAVVVARHGRRIGRVGVGLYWGSPSFYVDSTAVFLLPRATRIRQAAAGPFAEAAAAGVLAGIALLLPPGTAKAVLGAAAGLAALGVAVNLIPLLKLDGYWLLADALDKPDLHEQSLAAVRRVAGGSRERPDVLGASYALLGLVFGVALLVYSAYLWVELIGDVVVGAWSTSVLGKILALALVLPILGLVFQAVGSAVARAARGWSGQRDAAHEATASPEG